MMIIYTLKNHKTKAPLYTAEIDCEPSTPEPIKKKLAVVETVKNKVNLSRADLSGADLSRADLKWANLTDAVLDRAKFDGTDLRGVGFGDVSAENVDFSKALIDI